MDELQNSLKLAAKAEEEKKQDPMDTSLCVSESGGSSVFEKGSHRILLGITFVAAGLGIFYMATRKRS